MYFFDKLIYINIDRNYIWSHSTIKVHFVIFFIDRKILNQKPNLPFMFK